MIIGLPEPAIMFAQTHMVRDDTRTMAEKGLEMLQMLNDAQKATAEQILAAIKGDDPTVPRCFFIDGPGGTGKTFLYTTIINICRGMGKKVLAVAYTGIAAILLPEGRTCHTAFRLPLKLHASSSCHLTMREKEALKEVDIIVWDEAPMASSDMLECIDRLLKDLMKNERAPFGGKIMLLGGDFRQVLPVVKYGTKQQIIRQCIKSSPLWHNFLQISLTVNMRARPEEVAFAEWLLQLGSGDVPRPENSITSNSIAIPSQCISNDVLTSLFGKTFLPDDATIHHHVVLCPKNEDARERNEIILERLHGQKIHSKASI